MTIMLIFVVAFPAIATLLTKLILIDLAQLQSIIVNNLQKIDTTSIPKQLESMIGYNIEQMIDKLQLNVA